MLIVTLILSSFLEMSAANCNLLLPVIVWGIRRGWKRSEKINKERREDREKLIMMFWSLGKKWNDFVGHPFLPNLFSFPQSFRSKSAPNCFWTFLLSKPLFGILKTKVYIHYVNIEKLLDVLLWLLLIALKLCSLFGFCMILHTLFSWYESYSSLDLSYEFWYHISSNDSLLAQRMLHC